MSVLTKHWILSLLVLAILVYLISCVKDSQGDASKSEAPNSFDGVKWGTSVNEAYAYWQTKDGKPNLTGGNMVVSYVPGATQTPIIMDYYPYEGVQGKMYCKFIDKIGQSSGFSGAMFLYEDPEKDIQEGNEVIEEKRRLVKAIEMKAFNKLDSSFTAKYGPSKLKTEVNEKYNFKRISKLWFWKDKCKLELSYSIGITIKPDTRLAGSGVEVNISTTNASSPD